MGWLSRFVAKSDVTRWVDVAEAKYRQDDGALLVDVREADEWRAGHATGARHVPLGTLPQHLSELPRDRDLLLICRSGNRSGAACGMLARHGFDRAFNVTGG